MVELLTLLSEEQAQNGQSFIGRNTQCFDCCCHSAILPEVMPDRHLFLFVRKLLLSAHGRSGQVLPLFEFAMSALDGIFCRAPQLAKGGSNACCELDGSNTV